MSINDTTQAQQQSTSARSSYFPLSIDVEHKSDHWIEDSLNSHVETMESKRTSDHESERQNNSRNYDSMKARKLFDDSSTCCSTTCMEDSLSSLRITSLSQHQPVGFVTREREEGDCDDQIVKPYQVIKRPKGLHHLQGSSTSLASFSILSSDGCRSSDIEDFDSINDDDFESRTSETVEAPTYRIDSRSDQQVHYVRFNRYFRKKAETVRCGRNQIKFYERQRTNHRHRNSVQPPSIHIRSLPREREIMNLGEENVKEEKEKYNDNGTTTKMPTTTYVTKNKVVRSR